MKKAATLLIAIGLSLILPLTMVDGRAFAVPADGTGQSHVFVPGHRQVDVDINQINNNSEESNSLKQAQTFPDKYDSRDQSWYQGIKVKDQGESGLCWAFSTTTAAEISYAKETGGQIKSTSPAHIGYFFYNRVNDPLGNTGGDVNNLADPEENTWYDAGGNLFYTFQHLATWSGLRSEHETLFENMVRDFSDADAYDDTLVEQSCICYATCTPQQVKSLVQAYGAVVASLEWDYDYVNNDLSFYNFNTNTINNHEIAIIGWDDDYSKYNFSSIDEYGDLHTPEADGAWIIQNSWGTESGENGYYYVSYESGDILSDGICAYDMQPAGTYDYNFQYDGNASDYNYSFRRGGKAAHIYTAPSDTQILLSGIGFTTWNENETGRTYYTVDVYTGVDPAEGPDSGIKAFTTNVSSTTAGYKTFDFGQGVAIDAGETYSIVFTFRDYTWFGAESSDNSGTFHAATRRGQCYYSDNGRTWQDASRLNFSFRIKGLADRFTCIHDYQSKVTKPTFEHGGYTLFTCNHCGHQYIGDRTAKLTQAKPKTTTIKSLKPGKKSLTVKWTKQSKTFSGNHVTGYQIRYSTSKSFSSAKKVTVKGYKNTTKKLTKLKANKKYYVQIRTYIKTHGKTFWSSWSKKKSAKTK